MEYSQKLYDDPSLLHISEVGLEWILLALHSLLVDLTTSFGSVVRNLY